MRISRFTTAMGAIFAVSVLVACGGGGGGGSPTLPNPGGTPGAPGSSASPKSSSSPSSTATPLSTSSPIAPTPTPTTATTPTPKPTPTPTLGPTPTPNASATPNRKLTDVVGGGQINGDDTQFPGGIVAPRNPETNDGDYPNGGHGPTGSTIGPDAVPCLSSMYPGGVGQPGDGYHVHAFVGMYYNGSRVALPDGIGFADPDADFTYKGIPDWTNNATFQNGNPGCYYQMHTHDASGMIHIEGFPPAPPGGYGGQWGTLYTIGDFLAVWGIPVTSNDWGPLGGTITIYTSGQMHRGGPGTNPEIPSNQYTLYCALCDPATIDAIPLYSHEVIWVLVGSGNPTGSSLPNVEFETEW